MFFDLIVYTPMYVTFFWALVLLVTPNNRNRARFFLGFFMVIAFLVYLSHNLYFHKNIKGYLIFDPVYSFASLSVYPMYYWYIKLLTAEPEYRWHNLRMFIPALLFSLTAMMIYLFMSGEERIAYVREYLYRENMDFPFTLGKLQYVVYVLGRVVFAFQVIWFLIHGRKLVILHNERVANFYSNLESRTINWVKFLLYSLFATSAMSVLFNFLGRSVFTGSEFDLFIPSAVFSILLFITGFLGYMQNYTVNDLQEDESGEMELSIKEYTKIQLKEKLVELFQKEKIYVQPDLKITTVSSRLNTNRTYISGLINNEFGCTFNEYVNRMRISEAKHLLADSKFHNFSLEFIAEKSGFGSLSTFIRVFREFESITPGRFREKSMIQRDPSS